ncbi:MAG TPA: MFS transporter, partial [Chromatiales bacterium]|nr:MFS transporter [Chromatiales bacterium]
RYYHHPARHPGLGSQELELIQADQPVEQVSADGWSLRKLLRRREMWGLMLARFMNDGAFYFFMAWVPLYLAQERGFDIKQIALFAWMPYLAADLGSVGGGWLGRQLIRGGMSLDRSRKQIIWGGALMVLTALPVAGVQSPYAAIALIAVAMFSIQAKAANLFALPTDLYPANAVGKSWGLFGAVGAFGGMVFEGVAGWATDQVGYAPVFVAVAVTQLLSAAFVSLLIPKIRMLTE